MGRRAKRSAALEQSDEMLVLHQLIRREVTIFIEQALEEEFADFLQVHASKRLSNGMRAVVKNGYLPERRLLTQIGEISVRVPRARDRSDCGIRFSSVLLPPYLSRTRLHDELPAIFLKNQLHTGAQPADGGLLQSLLGAHVHNLAPATLQRIQARWHEHNQSWRERSLAGVYYLCWWAGAVPDAAGGYLLYIVGLQPTAGHNLLAVSSEAAENENAWSALLQSLRQRGFAGGPRLASARDRAGFWEAMARVQPGVHDLNSKPPTAFEASALHYAGAGIRYV